jgi:uncharacterized protein YgbK (DUF1537 family)
MIASPSLDLAATLASLPVEFPVKPRPAQAKLVVLDDDPTGTQTVHGVPVLTRWDEASLAAELRDPAPAVFLLTNTRAYPADRAVEINRATGTALRAAATTTGRPYIVVSRSDSTLRGHYPVETDALAKALGGVDATFLIPAFFPGGRYTIGDIHYVAEAERLIPAAETEFARDATFGYRNSHLRAWIEEKHAPKEVEISSLSIKDLRAGGARYVADRLIATPRGAVIIVNAAAPGDLAVLTHALADDRLRHCRHLFRTAASFVSIYAAIPPRPLLTPAELKDPTSLHGGLLVAGSYVGKTSTQLNHLFQTCPTLERHELAVPRLLDPTTREAEITAARVNLTAIIRSGRSAALYTSRLLITGEDAAGSLSIGTHVSLALVEIVRGLTVRPAWFVAKGGITSSDLATDALGLVRAHVLGQALPGVPVWRCGPESKWPDLAYTVFPGNVGGPEALARLLSTLI